MIGVWLLICLFLFSCNAEGDTIVHANQAGAIPYFDPPSWISDAQNLTMLSIKEEIIPLEGDTGIVYFSFNNGADWVNASNGLPQNVRIGLGGVAVSSKLLGVATKEYGIYLYDFAKSTWVQIPTDQQIIDGNIGAMAIWEHTIYIGTQHKGIFSSKNNGATWDTHNSNLNNLTIRRFFEFDNRLFVCTNGGFYSLNELSGNWQLEYGHNSLQVNGATVFKGNFYLATNQGIFMQGNDKKWANTSPNLSVHNISSNENQIFAMTYDELLLSSEDGITWKSAQEGLPKNLYTFNVLNHNNILLAGQWDGVYQKSKDNPEWERSSNGLPDNFAVTNLKAFNQILVLSTSERKLKEGAVIEK